MMNVQRRFHLRRCHKFTLAVVAAVTYPTVFISQSRGGDACGMSTQTARAASPQAQTVLESCAKPKEVVRHFRLPVWPAWFGLVYILLDFVSGSPRLGASLEDRFGGRVCPMFFEDSPDSDPFILVAHHRHSFNPFDPFRYIFRSILMPEGFPAHPHRGFETVTYVLRGGLVHRDSLGVKKSYGAPDEAQGSGQGAAVQWMTAGRGLLHEEMWRTNGAFDSTEQELFQIWVNLPARSKMVPPRMQLLGEPGQLIGNSADTVDGLKTEVKELGPVPTVSPAPGVTVRVVAGEADGIKSPVETFSAIAILHVTLEPGASWSWPREHGWSCLLYVRRGEATVGHPGTLVTVQQTVTLARSQETDHVLLTASNEGADVLLLSGEPLREPMAMGSNVIMNSDAELYQAERDLAAGKFGPSWRHTIDDSKWKASISEHWSSFDRRR